MYMSILSKLSFIHIYPWATCLHAYTFCGLIVFRICMYTLVCTWHTYALKFKSFGWISCLLSDFTRMMNLIFLRWFQLMISHEFHVFNIELDCPFSCWYVSHNTCTLTLFDVFSWLSFHEYNLCHMDFECLSDHVIFMFHEKYFCVIPCLKDFY